MKRSKFLKCININGKEYYIIDINAIEQKGITEVKKLPFSIKILAENLLRKLDDGVVQQEDLINMAKWKNSSDKSIEIPFYPARVLMQDFTGVPALVDLAAMRSAIKRFELDPQKINPVIPVELIIDHSIQVDYYGTSDSLKKNLAMEYMRNRERYTFLKWAQKNFKNLKVIPTNSGICHQINLEYLGRVVITKEEDGKTFAYPDTLVGTDSHSTMINGIGILGWGVGGIEAEAVMLGLPYYMPIPEVIGVKMVGELKEGISSTDLALTITEMLRKHNVVEKFVEYFGPGIKNLTAPDRATVANMAPEYGATTGFFPTDENTLEYLRLTNREDIANIVEKYTKAAGLFYTGNNDPEYTQVLEIDLSLIESSVAGPSRPQDRIPLKDLKNKAASIFKSGTKRVFNVNINGNNAELKDRSIVIAAITSCTNTSNPYLMVGAGLLAKNIVKKGLKSQPHIKTSFTPGSKIVKEYLKISKLLPYLEALGFHIGGFGCATCIGNSGPLHPEVERVISENNLNTFSVLSGNRNFEARIHPIIKHNFLMSPMLVLVFAVAGRINIDFANEPVGIDPNAEPVYLKDIWPTNKQIKNIIHKYTNKEYFKKVYNKILKEDEFWRSLKIADSVTYPWDKYSTYIQEPPYFKDFKLEITRPNDIENARVLLLLEDSVTTDHISPAGMITKNSPAGEYLIKKDIIQEDFNSYGSRRGNHEVMIRGTFANTKIKNMLIAPKEGGITVKFPDKKQLPIYDAAIQYQNEDTPLIILGGKEYGAGSSRDWAAKGTKLIGIKAIIANSYERIHRGNLLGMGVLPLEFKEGEDWKSLGLNGSETFFIKGIHNIKPKKVFKVKAVNENGKDINFEVISRLDTEIEVRYFENGGILPYILRKIIQTDKQPVFEQLR